MGVGGGGWSIPSSIVAAFTIGGLVEGGGGLGGVRRVCVFWIRGCGWGAGGRIESSVEPSFLGAGVSEEVGGGGSGVRSGLFMYGCLGSSIGWNFFLRAGGLGGV